MTNDEYTWTDNPTVSGVSVCNTDVLNDCLMHLKYDHKGNGAGLNLFDVIEKDHILTFEESKGLALQGTYVYKTGVSGSRYSYPDFYNKCVEEYGQAENTETVNGVTVKVHSNGHKFYDIADKTAIDELFNTMGSAWFYGVDTANERIFLPRNNNFVQLTVDTSQVNGSVEAGLPNIEGTFVADTYGSYAAGTGAFLPNPQNDTGAVASGHASGVGKSFSFDATRSNSIYGNSDTVQPPAVKKILYMVVGNTEVTSSITNVTEITTSENDTIPLFTAQYFDFTPNNPSWLKAGTQQNSGGIYTTAYNTLVNCLTDNIYNIKVVDTANMTSGVDYSEFWKVDQTAMTFTTPTSISNKALTGAVVGNGMALGLTDGTSQLVLTGFNSSSYGGRLAVNDSLQGSPVGTNNSAYKAENKLYGVTFDPTKSGIVAEESTTAQLYFKVANAVQNLELLDVGEVLEDVANKISRQDCPAYVVETYQNGASWYRVYSDGWCEQGGEIPATTTAVATKTATFYPSFVNTNYFAVGTTVKHNTYAGVLNKTTSSVSFSSQTSGGSLKEGILWFACGYIK